MYGAFGGSIFDQLGLTRSTAPTAHTIREKHAARIRELVDALASETEKRCLLEALSQVTKKIGELSLYVGPDLLIVALRNAADQLEEVHSQKDLIMSEVRTAHEAQRAEINELSELLGGGGEDEPVLN